MDSEGASYRDAGVDYDTLDAFKREAMMLAVATSDLMVARGAAPVSASRGEPAFVFEFAGRYLAFVVEGLGTKAMIAQAVLEHTGVNRFEAVAYDTVAAIINDLACVGALPLAVNAYFATGDSAWYENRERATQLLEGWQQACVDAGATWGGESHRRWRVSSPTARSSSPAPRSERCPPAGNRCSATRSPPATKSCSSTRPACMPTALRSPG